MGEFVCMCCRVVTGNLLTAYEKLVHDIRQYDTVVTHERAHVCISGEEFHTMAPKEWLGDACINMYIALLQVWCSTASMCHE
jgi:Ulp1 family protease